MARFMPLDTPRMPLKKVEAMFLPYWYIDSTFKLKTKAGGADQPLAEAHFRSLSYQMPAHSLEPLWSIPILPPQITKNLYKDVSPYEDFTLDHLNLPKTFKGNFWKPWTDHKTCRAPTKVTLVPFTASPFGLPELLRTAGEDVTTIDLSEDPRLGGFEKIILRGDTLEVDMLAACPVLLPVYVYQYEPAVGDNGALLPPVIVVADASGEARVYSSRCLFDR